MMHYVRCLPAHAHQRMRTDVMCHSQLHVPSCNHCYFIYQPRACCARRDQPGPAARQRVASPRLGPLDNRRMNPTRIRKSNLPYHALADVIFTHTAHDHSNAAQQYFHYRCHADMLSSAEAERFAPAFLPETAACSRSSDPFVPPSLAFRHPASRGPLRHTHWHRTVQRNAAGTRTLT